MPLIRQTSLTPFVRLALMLALVCALLATQWALNRHVVGHSHLQTASAVNSADTDALTQSSTTDEGAGCLLCLEHQAHGTALTNATVLSLALTVALLMARALPPNVPFLAPERARQRAPPASS